MKKIDIKQKMNFKKVLHVLKFSATFSAPITHLLGISQWSCALLLNNKSC